MNNFIKQVIEEKFASKAQQRYFYAQAGKGGKKGKKWAKWAKEFSDKTDFSEIPDKIEKEVEEIVDDKGNISRGKKPLNFNTKGITQDETTDEVVLKSGGSMGNHAFGQMGGGPRGSVGASLKYWAEADLSKSLGYKDTLAKDEDFEDAEKHYKDELDLGDKEVDKKMSDIGYDPELEDGKVRLVENPKKFVEEYLESILNKKSNNQELVKKGDGEIKEINSIVKRQLKSLKDTMNSNNLTIDDIMNYLKDNE